MIMHYIDDDERYLCNKACSVTDEKCTSNPVEVSCKNCKRALKKQ